MLANCCKLGLHLKHTHCRYPFHPSPSSWTQATTFCCATNRYNHQKGSTGASCGSSFSFSFFPMPPSRPDHTPMDQELQLSTSTALQQTQRPAHAKKQARARFNDEEIDSISASTKYQTSTAEMTDDPAHRARQRGLRPSIETDDDLDMAQKEVNRARTRSRSKPKALHFCLEESGRE